MLRTSSVVLVLLALWPQPAAAQSVTYTTLVRSNVGSTDGVGSAARFNGPRGISIDASDNLYVLDRSGSSLRKISPGAVVSTLIPADGTIFGVTLAATPPGEVLFINMTSAVVRKRALDGTLSVVYAGSRPGPFIIQNNGLVLDAGGVMYANDAFGVWRLGSDNTAVRVAGSESALGFADGPVGAAQYDNAFGIAIDRGGIIYVSDQHGTVVRRVTPDGVTTTIAGLHGSTGTADGTGTAARFSGAGPLVCDAAGNIYVGEGGGRIRKVTPQGVVTTFVDSSAGIGSVSSLTMDSSGNLFVADSSQSVVWKITLDGTVGVFAGLRVATSAGVLASLQQPAGVAVDRDGNAVIADSGAHTVNLLAGGAVTTIAGATSAAGSADGPAAVTALLGRPTGLVVTSPGDLYFTDSANHIIRRIAPDGSVTTIAGRSGARGTADGTGANARFAFPSGFALDASGNLLVADDLNCAIRKITPAGVVTTLAGLAGSCGSVDGDAAAARFNRPSAVAVDSGGNVLVADTSNATIRRISPQGVVSTLAGQALSPGSADGTGSAARFDTPSAIAVDASGNAFVHSRQTIRKVTPSGVVTTVAGAFGVFGTADGTGSVARFASVAALAFGPDGTLFIADSFRVRAMTPSATVTTIAGSVNGYIDGTGANARFGELGGIAIDAASTIYVSDRDNSLIRRVTTAGVVDTFDGVQNTPLTQPIDGAARATGRLNAPHGVVVAGDGSIFIADTGNHAIRKLATNQLTTFAGLAGSAGTVDAVGRAARFSAPVGLARDAAGNLYVADTGNHTIRKISADGTVTTVAGQAGIAGSADGAGAAARFNGPRGLAMDSTGTLYVTDTGNHVIRAITSGGVVSTLAGTPGSSGSADGSGASARFSSPDGLVIAGGVIYVDDFGNQLIRAITTSGVVTTAGGAAGAPGLVDGDAATARFNGPTGLGADAAGAIYVTDLFNGALRIGVVGTAVAPSITVQPVSRAVALHQTVQLTCDASGNPTPSFRWIGVSTTGGGSFLSESTTFSGVSTRTLIIKDVGAAQNGTRYRCEARSVAGSDRSTDATLTVSVLTVTPPRLAFGAIVAPGGGYSSVTPPKTVTVGWAGPGAPAWSVTADKPWVQITNGSGRGAGQFTVSVGDPGNIGLNTAVATMTFIGEDPELNLTMSVAFAPYASNAAPVGVIDTPANNATGLQGSLAVTGWALDDIEMDHVELWRDRVVGETTPVFDGSGPGNGKIFISNATFVPGARPDVERSYGSFKPDAASAGWGYMLLTQGLWNQGNGTYTLYAFAFDKAGLSSAIGTKTIAVDNAHATKPFGTIDTPTYGGTVSGVVTNFGWALTPGPTCTITNPNVQVSIDSGALAPVVYGDVRTDVAAAFPGYTNAAAAGGHSTLDTTTLTNGMHTIGWVVTDSCGRAEGMGSRFFTVTNSGSIATTATAPAATARTFASPDWSVRRTDGSNDAPAAAADGTRVVRVAEGERIELQLPGGETYTARQVGNASSPDLPIGSSFDAAAGKFYWQPGAGFLGAYELEFTAGTRTERVRAVVGPPIRMVIDTPRAGTVLSASGFTLAGWAVDLTSLEGAGIDALHVWAYPVGGEAPRFVGVAKAGGARPDVADLSGAAFRDAGFTLTGMLAPGTYDLAVFAHSAATNAFEGAQVVRMVVR